MKIKTLFGCAAFLLLFGCSSLQPGRSHEERVTQRAHQQMTAFLEKDYQTAYTYMSPGYKDTHTLHRFASDFSGMVDLQGFSIEKAECESETRCTVTINRQQKAFAGLLGSTSERPVILPMAGQQTWILVKGKWYHYKR